MNKEFTAPEQPNIPSTPNEEIKCPKCGAVGCTPQYKQNVSGGGYGCCQGVLGSLILGPLGLLCGLCGQSAKTTNTLVWICPKCGHEFQTNSKKNAKTAYVTVCCVLSLIYLLTAFFVPSSRNPGIVPSKVLAIAVYYSLIWYIGICKTRVVYTDEEKQQLKVVTAISLICSLIFALF